MRVSACLAIPVEGTRHLLQTRMPHGMAGFFLHSPWRRKSLRAQKNPQALAVPGFWGCLVPIVGIELTTYRLQGGCSTTELNRRSAYSNREAGGFPPALRLT